VDLEEAQSVGRWVAEIRPEVIIHCAAVSVPADCESDKERATRINTHLPAALARHAQDLGARLLHISTDLVFSGQCAPYSEDDACDPISHYGHTKLMAERMVLSRCPNSVVARTSLLIGASPRGDRGVDEQIERALMRGASPRLFTDEYRTPVGARDLARVLVALGRHPFCGVLHVTGQETLSRYEMGVIIARARGHPVERLVAASLSDARGVHPPRAPNTALRTERLRSLVPPVPTPRNLQQVMEAVRRAPV
jgi:dTDP-4-dehydrorhamnose reductase